ncbi:growth/differentiation factor 8-like [Limulus polyphemus]|uniref:Growth/differentiation factor 8-like n=1 Tax=Limulus polyphemus TaxID=6850 RepID=A0ABM1SAY1_LIMPO|nr:growth/differentiation factor 8-like [Limulus polyphemus]
MTLTRNRTAVLHQSKVLLGAMCLVLTVCALGVPSPTEKPSNQQDDNIGNLKVLSTMDLEARNLTEQIDFLLQQQKELSEEAAENDETNHVGKNTEIVTQGSRRCQKCLTPEQEKKQRLEMIKAQILTKLGMSQPPNITRKNLQNIPPLYDIVNRYNLQVDVPFFQRDPADEDTATTDLAFAFATNTPLEYDQSVEKNVLHFDFSEKVMKSHLKKAHLWLYLQPMKDLQHGGVTVYINQVVRGIESPSLLQHRVKHVDLRGHHGRWIKLGVRKVVSHWINHPKDNLGLVIQTEDYKGNIVPISYPSESDEESHRPFIEIEMKKPQATRSKRDSDGLECDIETTEVRCCRYPLTVDFVDFKWDWVIAPKRYEANYCSGECPFVFLHRYPHTHLVQQIDPLGSIGPCCAPSKMSSITMLYFNDNSNIILGVLPGMVVKRCGCS